MDILFIIIYMLNLKFFTKKTKNKLNLFSKEYIIKYNIHYFDYISVLPRLL